MTFSLLQTLRYHFLLCPIFSVDPPSPDFGRIISMSRPNPKYYYQEYEWRKKVDFESLDSIPSMLSDRSDLGYAPGSGHISDHMNRMCLDPDFSPDEQEEKARLIAQVRVMAIRNICWRHWINIIKKRFSMFWPE